VTGLLVGSEQTVIPVVSDPNLIFFVLRDPPGGTSTTTLKSGHFSIIPNDFLPLSSSNTCSSPSSPLCTVATNIEFDISIEGMFTHETNTGGSIKWQMESEMMSTGETPRRSLRQFLSSSVSSSTMKQTHATRESDSHYRYSFSFEYDISTSSNPYFAGHASDVIVGGGISIAIRENVFRGNVTHFFTSSFLSFNEILPPSPLPPPLL
jgi:hypothetical protein